MKCLAITFFLLLTVASLVSAGDTHSVGQTLQDVNLLRIKGGPPSTGSGATDSGTLRVSIATDQAPVAVTATVSPSTAPVTVSTGSITAFQGGVWTIGIIPQISIAATVMEIPVSGGSGQIMFSSTGSVNQCSIIPPTEESSYIFEIVTNTADQFNVFGSNRGLTGSVSLAANRFFLGSHLANITGATVDGYYKVRCVYSK